MTEYDEWNEIIIELSVKLCSWVGVMKLKESNNLLTLVSLFLRKKTQLKTIGGIKCRQTTKKIERLLWVLRCAQQLKILKHNIIKVWMIFFLLFVERVEGIKNKTNENSLLFHIDSFGLFSLFICRIFVWVGGKNECINCFGNDCLQPQETPKKLKKPFNYQKFNTVSCVNSRLSRLIYCDLVETFE